MEAAEMKPSFSEDVSLIDLDNDGPEFRNGFTVHSNNSDGTESSGNDESVNCNHVNRNSQAMSLQHDLEKLQEAHNKLMEELNAKNKFAEQVHVQLDKAITENDAVREQLTQAELDLQKASKLIVEKEDKLNQLTGNRDEVR
ncbi:hypothetical protein HDE_02074 [Halotydeus destructor]|nr:hypothetical protein HDE_02074 [Halotydeus destructor]